uniref:Uncharacterized protein n=1 Tax=uncultured bacterium contig00115 TaxID=1181577 RepID=A0A806KSV0_9BACT|nr:hypothetical protein [uncultured bacterium contig00115]
MVDVFLTVPPVMLNLAAVAVPESARKIVPELGAIFADVTVAVPEMVTTPVEAL